MDHDDRLAVYGVRVQPWGVPCSCSSAEEHEARGCERDDAVVQDDE